MSIDRCNRCERPIDTDYVDDCYHTIAGELICVHWDCLTEQEQKEVEGN